MNPQLVGIEELTGTYPFDIRQSMKAMRLNRFFWQMREASARAFSGWCTAIEERLRAETWPTVEAKDVAVAVISLIEGALILSRIAGDADALVAAKPAARRLLRR